jgi:hypothetical protein
MPLERGIRFWYEPSKIPKDIFITSRGIGVTETSAPGAQNLAPFGDQCAMKNDQITLEPLLWSFLDEHPGADIHMVDSGLRGSAKSELIATLRAQPEWHSSDLILLDESDIPDDLIGRVKFRSPRNSTEIL